MNETAINAITERIIAAAIRVRKELGLGFLEKVYENSMRIELRLDVKRVAGSALMES